MPPRPVLADSLRCISSCLAFLFRSSVASSSLFYNASQHRRLASLLKKDIILTLAIISWMRSSWLSISRKVLIWLMVRFSL